ncbi:Uncharacterised protein [Mycobacteroides abscessus subsp. abscessus]|nr:Uncharacterised protein [Mycobacteroides abscessus subsp. abscessus]
MSASDPMVRPWKAPSAATTLVRPVRRVSLKAASLASVPELQRKTLPGTPSRATSASESSMAGPVAYRFDVWPRVESCWVTASMTDWLRCPSTLTAIPPNRSRYRLPSTSVTTAPSPSARTIGGVP